MIKKTVLFFLLTLAFSNCKVFRKSEIYGGLNGAHLVSNDFGQFDISDLDTVNEGRVMVDLNNVKPNSISFGFVLGYKIPVSKKITLFPEFRIGLPGTFSIGMDYKLIQKEKFTLGLTPKIGGFLGTYKLGRTQSAPGFASPAKLGGTGWSNFWVSPGDKINLICDGIIAGIGLSPKYKINSHFSVSGFVGVNISYAINNQLEFPDKDYGWYTTHTEKLDWGEDNFVKSDGTKTPSGLTPTVKPSGIAFNIGISYRLGRKD